MTLRVNNFGLITDKEIPLYHASVNAQAIVAEGFKKARDLPNHIRGLGSAGTNTISMTGDIRYAEAICVHLATHARIGIGDLGWGELMVDFRKACPEANKKLFSPDNAEGEKIKKEIELLKLATKGKWRVRKLYMKTEYQTDLTGEGEVIPLSEFIEARRLKYENKGWEHMLTEYTNPAKSLLAKIYNKLLWFGCAENPVGNTHTWTQFVGNDLSVLEEICVVEAFLKPNQIIVPRSSKELSVLFGRSEFSTNEFVVERQEPKNFKEPWYPRIDVVEGLPFNVVVEEDFVKELDEDTVSRMVAFLPAEDEFRVPNPAKQMSHPKVLYCALDIIEDLNRKWRRGSDITCFYPDFEKSTLIDNLLVY